MVKIAPSLLSADIAKLAEEIKKVEKHVDMFHVDVMDGHFVPNITYGPLFVEAVNRITDLPIEAHLMIENPGKYIGEFAKAGADIITIHPEADKNFLGTLKKIRALGVKAGVSINPPTPFSTIKDCFEDMDFFLVMSVNPGFAGQKFIESVLPKITAAKEIIQKKKLNIPIEIDGGINAETGKRAVEAGVDILVAGSYIYKSHNAAKAIASLRR
ncbi:MAG: ribulose-phosphate 3-epimerase [Candidatus Woesearchaeota archaeon]